MTRRILPWSVIVVNAIGLLVSVWQRGWLDWVNFFLLLNLVCFWLLQNAIMNLLNELLLAASLGIKTGNRELAIKKYIEKAKALENDVQLIVSEISGIGQDHFAPKVQALHDEYIRASLLSSNDNIIKLRKKEQENNWITLGLAAIAELKQKGNDMAEYSFQTISEIVKYLHANQGSFFLLRSDGADQYFQLTATYAYSKKKYQEARISPGEGLIGQVFYEKEIIYMTDIPKDYVRITSGLGEALPRCICVVPLLSEGKILGVIEIASFSTLGEAEMEYLKRISENIGYNLSVIETNSRTKILLDESQKKTEELKSLEEELRQNMEELATTQEQMMKRKESEMDAVFSSLSTVELDVEGNVIHANSIFLSITGFKLEDIKGKLYKNLIPQSGNDPIQYEIMWSSILEGRAFSGEFRIVNKAQKELWMAGNFTPLLNESGTPYKIMVISLFTGQDKEKLLELQEMVMAIKNCFAIAEINPDLTFKSANDLFLTEIGIKRLELRKTLPEHVLSNESFAIVKKHLSHPEANSINMTIDILSKSGVTKKFGSTLIQMNNSADKKKRGMLILRSEM
jgi:PAS domain S-box-containing protein